MNDINLFFIDIKMNIFYLRQSFILSNVRAIHLYEILTWASVINFVRGNFGQAVAKFHQLTRPSFDRCIHRRFFFAY